MTRYRITYAPPADTALTKMTGAERFRAELERTLGADPYGHGSSQVGSDRDRREATVTGVIIRYYVSGSVFTNTVVRVVPFPP